jgi:membrane protein required for beta-lactamase induction
MKQLAVVMALAAVSSCALAAEARAVCMSPEIPSVSTSQAGADRVRKSLKEWEQCVADNPGTDAALVAKVSEKARSWLAATARYSGGQSNGQAVVAQDAHAQQQHRKDVRTDVRSKQPQSAQEPR